MRGNVFVMSAPSGTGKSTICEILTKRLPNLIRSVSYTTRPPRSNETNGKDYFFISRKEFDSMIEMDAFAEWAEIYSHRYGTSRAFLLAHIEKGLDVILSIDVQGAMKLETSIFNPLRIFLLPPSLEELKRRLVNRGSEKEDFIRVRLDSALKEMRYWKQYDYIVVNDRLDEAAKQVESIIISQRRKTDKVENEVTSLLRSFGIE